jgi:hypothetical protein
MAARGKFVCRLVAAGILPAVALGFQPGGKNSHPRKSHEIA